MQKIKTLFVGALVAAASSLAFSAPVATAFTKSADLDFQGSFAYALTMNETAAGAKIGDATFTSAVDGSTPGVSFFSNHYIPNWHDQNYGASANDVALRAVMQSIIWSDGNDNATVMRLSVSGLTVGQTYQTQLLFAESCCDRGFDIFENGLQVANDFSANSLSGGNGSAAFINSFLATTSTMNFEFGGAGGHGDHNPILSALTLEAVGDPASVPEPGTLALLGAALLGMGALQRRKAS